MADTPQIPNNTTSHMATPQSQPMNSATDSVERIYHSSTQAQPHQASSSSNAQQNVKVMPMQSKKKFRFLPKTWHKVVFGLFLIILLVGSIVGAVGFYTFTVAMQLKAQESDIQASAKSAYDQFKDQNLPGAEQGLKDVDTKLTAMEATYQKLSFYSNVPVAQLYYKDGLHGFAAAKAGISAGLKSLDAINPYADVLGFKGKGSFTGGTAEDRIKEILLALQKVTPVLDGVTSDLQTMQNELAQIDEKRYPENFQGKPLRSYIQKAHELSSGAVVAVTQFRPALEEIPAAGGATGHRQKYLFLFQNDKERRPTGGFLTAYSIVFVENGKVTIDKSDDIYQLDKKFTTKLPIPDILGKYLTTEKYWNLRDMNTNPDFKLSMDQFVKYYKQVKGEPNDFDGVIALDTHVLTDLVDILGPVDVEGYGTFSTEKTPKCNCPQIIYALSEITDRPTPYIRQDRKGILGPMMKTILTKAYSAPHNLWPQLFETGWNEIQGRHVQMYFFDPKLQQAAEIADAAGRMTPDPKGGDFFAVVDANLGGAKSNLFISTTMEQQVAPPSSGTIDKKVTLVYKNSRQGDNCNLEAGLLCLNATLKDWNRLYLPLGSKLVKAVGYKEGTARQYDENGFTVIEGQFNLEPMSQAKLEVEYTVPYTDTSTYRLKLWKQGGADLIPVVVDVNGNQDKIDFDKDITYQTSFK